MPGVTNALSFRFLIPPPASPRRRALSAWVAAGTASHSLSVNPEELKLNHQFRCHQNSALQDRPGIFAPSTMSSMGPDPPDDAGVLRLPDLGGAKMRERFLTPPLVAPDTPRPRTAGRFSDRCERDACGCSTFVAWVTTQNSTTRRRTELVVDRAPLPVIRAS